MTSTPSIVPTDTAQRPQGPTTVMVVDDQLPFRVAARAVVARMSDFEIVAETGSGEEAVERVDAVRPDLVLMDVHMDGIDGMEATRRIVSSHPGVKVILVSTYAATDLPAGARESGAIAYIDKDELSARVLRRVWASDGDPGWRTI